MKKSLFIVILMLIVSVSFGQLGRGVSKNGVETLTNKTLTLPKINENVVVNATATEINNVVGSTSNIQDQLNNDIDLQAALDSIGITSDSIPEQANPPATGNIYINSVTGDLWWKAGNQWYTVTKGDSIPIPSTLLNDLVECWESNGTTWVGRVNAFNGAIVGQARVDSVGVGGTGYAMAVNISDETNDDYVTVGDNVAFHLTGSYTVSTWFRSKAYSVGDGSIFTLLQGTTFTSAIYLGYNQAASSSAGGANRSGMSPVARDVNHWPVNDAWHNLIVVFDGTGSTFYFDGVAGPKIDQTGTPSNTWGSGIHFGRFYTSNIFRGLIGQTGFWRRGLTLSEIADLVNGGNGLPFALWGAQ